MTHEEKIEVEEVLRKKYDLDHIDVSRGRVYLHFGRDLLAKEFDDVYKQIKALQEEL